LGTEDVTKKFHNRLAQSKGLADLRGVVEVAQPKMRFGEVASVVFPNGLVTVSLDVDRKIELLGVGHRVGHVLDISVDLGVGDDLAEAYVPKSHPVDQCLAKVVRGGQIPQVVDVGVDFGIDPIEPRKSLRIETW
jgi:hypothetical protein